MDETANEIETQVDRTRERLDSNLRELEDRIDAATNWREYFQERPHLLLGAAFLGGVALGSALRRTAPTGEGGDVGVRRAIGGNSSVHAQVSQLWNNVQVALVGVAGARIKEYIGELVPGFDEHYRRSEQRASALDPTTASLGRTTG
jgi:hypothetical protein